MIQTEVYIVCDIGLGGCEINFGIALNEKGKPIGRRELRKKAKNHGWIRERGKDICPTCKTKK